MAVAGGACAAYRVQVRDRQIDVQGTTTLRSMCTAVEEAMLRLSRGEVVTVAGSDMAEIRRRIDLVLGRAWA
jgi:hypothetical protein